MIYEFGTEQINQKLCEKEESGYQSNVTAVSYTHLDVYKRQLLSNDSGVAFIVKTKEGTIYHAGDLNDWYWDCLLYTSRCV